MVAKAQVRGPPKGVLGSLLRSSNTVIGRKLLLLLRETVCLTQIQVVDYDSFFGLHRILPHILPHIKIRVTEGVSKSDLDFV
jgi:hypothetical protein